MDVVFAVEQALHDRKRAWLLTAVLPFAMLMVDVLLLAKGYSNTLTMFAAIFGMFAGISLVPVFLTYRLLGETNRYGGMTFLSAWRVLSLIFPLALAAFGIFFVLHFTSLAVILGLISIAICFVCVVLIKQAYLYRISAARAKKRKVQALLRKRKEKPPIDLERLKQKEDEFVKDAMQKIKVKKVKKG